jgi:anti-anti-sigma factor
MPGGEAMAIFSVMIGQEQGSVPVTVLRVEGDIDAATHKTLEEKASEVIGAGTQNILLDLSEVKYMGSAGFRAIHAINNMLEQEETTGMGRSKHLKLLNPQGEVARVIKTLGFDVFLDIYHDREDALNAF